MPSILTNDIAIAADQLCFAVLETTKGTLAFPTNANTVIASAGYVEMSQNPSFTDSEEITNSRDVLNRFQDQAPAGTWSVPIYARPSGSAGSAPMGDVFFQSLFGTKTINSSTSVVYTQDMYKPSFSLWSKRGHTVFFAKGAVCTKLGFNATNKGGAKFDLSGGFMSMGWAGTDEVASAVTQGATTVPVTDAKKFTVGARIYNVTKNQNNSAAGFEVTAINYSTNVLTLGTAVPSGGWVQYDIIAGYLPTTGTAVGEALEGKDVTISFAGINSPIQSLSLDIDDGVKYMEDEISSQAYPTDYMEQIRNISGNMSLYFRTNDVKYFYNGYNNNQIAVVIQVNDVAGKQLTITLPKTELEVPSPKTAAPAINLDVKYKALGSSGEDSCSMTWA
jgi:hypothetical protein